MSMQDPISDMLTRIRNSLSSSKNFVLVPFSKQKSSIANILYQEGYIRNFRINKIKRKFFLQIELKYYRGTSVIDIIKRVSRPGLRIYKSFDSLPKIHSGFGTVVISTSNGLMSDREARIKKIGGEVLFYVA